MSETKLAILSMKIEERKEELESDNRLKRGTATLDTNATLALIQTDLEARINELQRVLEYLEDTEENYE